MEQLIIERGVVRKLEDLPPKSIALDGYVQGPEIDLENQRFSFDHHDKCIRLVTRATCQQVMDAILLGMDPDEVTVYVNDVDGDTVMSVWLLRNPHQVVFERVCKLVDIVGLMDAHGPAYPIFSRGTVTAFFEHVMKPERDARRDGSYQTCDLGELLDQCLANLDFYVAQGTPIIPPSELPKFEVLLTGDCGWAMATGEGFIFPSLYKHGYTRVIAYSKLPDGTYNYTVGKMSEFVSGFPVGPVSDEKTILAHLNALEPGWGGGSTIGGSPRNEDGSSSKFSPDELFEIVEEFLEGSA